MVILYLPRHYIHILPRDYQKYFRGACIGNLLQVPLAVAGP